ncbi:MAG: SixA phosphatase family protein, partial [Gaiellales bacterium]
MTDVVIVRHAIAEERDPQRWPDDGLRPLTAFGRERFAPAARGLGTLVGRPERVLASPYVRTWQTAEILCA